ncbi:MAG: DUF1697 domain-containing protein [Candidatus Saccharimonadaceae bacterium]
MTTYISILRGINVGGKKLIKMNALITLYEQLNFNNVRTYIQSGNVIFTYSETDVKELEGKIANEIAKVYGFNVPVIVLTKDSLQKIIDQNPFVNDAAKDISFLHITFLDSTPHEYDLKVIEGKKEVGEELHITHSAIYLYLPYGYAKTKLNNIYFESKLKVDATTRNWKTAKELLNVANN